MTTATTDDARCAHQSCRCRASERHGDFCSLYCMNAEGDAPPSGACACDHAACREPKQEREPDDEDVQTALGPRPGR